MIAKQIIFLLYKIHQQLKNKEALRGKKSLFSVIHWLVTIKEQLMVNIGFIVLNHIKQFIHEVKFTIQKMKYCNIKSRKVFQNNSHPS